jgi:outer membrane murein-binding lipoprotein Lpp
MGGKSRKESAGPQKVAGPKNRGRRVTGKMGLDAGSHLRSKPPARGEPRDRTWGSGRESPLPAPKKITISSDANTVSSEVNAIMSEVDAISSEANAIMSEVDVFSSEVNAIMSEANVFSSEVDAIMSEANAISSEVNAIMSEANMISSEVIAISSEEITIYSEEITILPTKNVFLTAADGHKTVETGLN